MIAGNRDISGEEDYKCPLVGLVRTPVTHVRRDDTSQFTIGDSQFTLLVRYGVAWGIYPIRDQEPPHLYPQA